MRSERARTLPRLLVGAIAALGLAGLTLGVATPAAADVATQIAFDQPGATATFGSDWVVPVTVTASDFGVLDGPAGTVSIFVEGVAGAYAEGMPIYRGGVAFFAQPDARPPLGAGAHLLTAVFTPAAGSGLMTSQTATPFTLTITPLALEAHAAVDEAVGDEAAPYLHLWLSGEFVDALGAPAGSWEVALGSDDARTMTLEQPAGSADPLEVSLADDVRPGRTLEVTATFLPDPAVAGGIELSGPEPVSYQAPSRSPGDLLASSVLLPWWLVIVLLLLLAGVVAALVVLLVQRRKARDAVVADAAAEGTPGATSPGPPDA